MKRENFELEQVGRCLKAWSLWNVLSFQTIAFYDLQCRDLNVVCHGPGISRNILVFLRYINAVKIL